MLVISTLLTLGQLTFLLRVVVQGLSLIGPPLIGLVVLTYTPRIASLNTHDLINRIIAAQSVMPSSVRWLWNYVRGSNRDPVRSIHLPISIVLLVLYGLFASLNDIGFLGLYSCSVPAATVRKADHPASINDFDTAQASIISSFINGSTIDNVAAYRCDSVVASIGVNRTLMQCTAWRNSTWADANLFGDVNTTDSDMLIPRKIAAEAGDGDGTNPTAYTVDTGTKRILKPTIRGGILVYPHEIGVQAIFGVPQLGRNQSVTLGKTMALEIETGCMNLGIYSSYLGTTRVSTTSDMIWTNEGWSKYSGPDILHEPLLQVATQIRSYWIPAFNLSEIREDGALFNTNGTTTFFTRTVTAQEVRLPDFNGTVDSEEWALWFKGNCTHLVNQQVGLPTDRSDIWSCNMLGLNGQIENIGMVFGMQNHYICASTSQLNMVSATIRSNDQGSITIDALTRLPSDLHHLTSDAWDESGTEGEQEPLIYEPIQRYTLSDNTDGPTSHYIHQGDPTSGLSRNDTIIVTEFRPSGPANAGPALSKAGSRILSLRSDYDPTYAAIQEVGLDTENALPYISTPLTLTQWAGQVGAAFILNSLQYNGWAALNQAPLLVTTQNSEIAICYHPPYIAGFAPLILAAMWVGSWFVGVLITTSLKSLRDLGELYGGMRPYWRTVRPDLKAENIFLIWRETDMRHQQTQQDRSSIRGDSGHDASTMTNVEARLDVIGSNGINTPVELIRKDNPRAVDYIAGRGTAFSDALELEQEVSDLLGIDCKLTHYFNDSLYSFLFKFLTMKIKYPR